MRTLPRRPPRALLAGVSMVAGLAAGLHARAVRAVETLPMEDAVALALRRNRDAIAARLEIDGAALDVVAAGLYPNPSLQYSVGNLVLGSANTQSGQIAGAQGTFAQPVQTVGISQLILARAETTLRVSERSYKAGAISLLELLDAQRTYLQARGDYLRAVNDFRQAAIDVAHAVGGPLP